MLPSEGAFPFVQKDDSILLISTAARFKPLTTARLFLGDCGKARINLINFNSCHLTFFQLTCWHLGNSTSAANSAFHLQHSVRFRQSLIAQESLYYRVPPVIFPAHFCSSAKQFTTEYKYCRLKKELWKFTYWSCEIFAAVTHVTVTHLTICHMHVTIIFFRLKW